MSPSVASAKPLLKRTSRYLLASAATAAGEALVLGLPSASRPCFAGLLGGGVAECERPRLGLVECLAGEVGFEARTEKLLVAGAVVVVHPESFWVSSCSNERQRVVAFVESPRRAATEASPARQYSSVAVSSISRARSEASR